MSSRDAHHRRQRQRDNCRDDYRHCYRHRELAEQASDNPAHEEKRNEHRHQRQADRHDREADLAGALEGGLERLLPVLDMPDDVLQHHDRVVDDEADGNGQRHQREIVEAVAERCTSAGNVPTSDSGTVTLGMTVAQKFRRKTKITITTSAIVSISVNCTS